ncbi:hypothetical protein BT93_L4925 [Corymbia citriodora subsp. variegata]|uniref:Glutamine amidotransferase type-2 domain-containing protein n=1 Tax=Corymbia citriodora subsp. variegata TaxID=360336 RepID=A0A8T0CHG4_CORYI|nr:hypothetical protein BT93_L4925 [Corymbia citriodora subsp. variegata]
MCRFLVYKGAKPIVLSKLVTEPAHSILTQSYDSRLRLDRRRPVNGDGFGLGWYTDVELGYDPCIFTSTIPAWNCSNLERLAKKVQSRLVFAHVRATTEGSLAEDNCHPFQHNTIMFMHNGNVGAWKYVKRRISDFLDDRWYMQIRGGTDSEMCFALFLHMLAQEGVDPSATPYQGFGAKKLRKAMVKTIAKINELIKSSTCTNAELTEVDTRSLLNFAVTDGHSVVITRYVSSKTDEAASLYYSSGTDWVDEGSYQFVMERRDKASDVILVASEPLTFERHNWLPVPTNTIVTIEGQTVSVVPIKDEYFDPNPIADRNTSFAKQKGLISKQPGGPTLVPSGVATPQPDNSTNGISHRGQHWSISGTIEDFKYKVDNLALTAPRTSNHSNRASSLQA